MSSTEQRSVKFGIVDFYELLSRNSKFGYNWAKMLGTLHEDLICSIVTGDIKSP